MPGGEGERPLGDRALHARDPRAGDLVAGAEQFLPERTDDLAALRAASARCTGCPLHARATQTVFGSGEAGSRLMLVGEQPGDSEDTAGEPFVGPAGRLLDQALSLAGIDRSVCYVTNAVKHFKWEERGKRRVHKAPSAREVEACMPWVLAELLAVKPEVVVCLGATAARALLGRGVRVSRDHGAAFSGPGGLTTLVTVHPSSILRVSGGADRQVEMGRFVADLRGVARHLNGESLLVGAAPPV